MPTVGIAVGNKCCNLPSVIAVDNSLCNHTSVSSVDKMDYEDFSADENIVLAKRVLKRKEKRSEEDCSDGDCSISRRKKKRAPDTTDDEFVRPSPKSKKIVIPSESDTEQPTELKTYKKFPHYCNSLNAQQINEKSLRKIKEYVTAMLQSIPHLS